MALIDVYSAYVDENALKQKIIAATIIAAGTILGEDPGTARHNERVEWALAVMDKGLIKGAEMYFYLLRDATVLNAIVTQSDPTDAQIQTFVDNNIDNLV